MLANHENLFETPSRQITSLVCFKLPDSIWLMDKTFVLWLEPICWYHYYFLIGQPYKMLPSFVVGILLNYALFPARLHTVHNSSLEGQLCTIYSALPSVCCTLHTRVAGLNYFRILFSDKTESVRFTESIFHVACCQTAGYSAITV